MTRFEVLLVIALLLVTLAGLGLRWLWRQWGLRQLTPIKKAMIVVVFLGCLLALSLAGAAFWGLWLERPKPVTTDDLRLLEKADALLKDESGWNRNDDRACDDDRATGKFISSARWRQPVRSAGEYRSSEGRATGSPGRRRGGNPAKEVRASTDGLQQSAGDTFRRRRANATDVGTASSGSAEATAAVMPPDKRLERTAGKRGRSTADR